MSEDHKIEPITVIVEFTRDQAEAAWECINRCVGQGRTVGAEAAIENTGRVLKAAIDASGGGGGRGSMTGWDALKTGRRVRQKGMSSWLVFRRAQFDDPIDPNLWLSITPDVLHKDDWEVEPRSVEVTIEKVREAWDKARVFVGTCDETAEKSAHFRAMCRILQLGECLS